MSRRSEIWEPLTRKECEGLLPCPWCGEYEESKQNFLARVKDCHGWIYVRCDGCSASPEFACTSWDEAVLRWNSRIVLSSSNEYLSGIAAARRQMQDYLRLLPIGEGHVEVITEPA